MISVIIPTYNAGTSFGDLIAALQSQTVAVEIIVLDSSSSDDTAKIAEIFGSKTVLIKKNQFDHGGTRTLGARSASGDILVYLTQDVLPPDKYAVEKLIKPFDDPWVGAVFGRQLPRPDAGPFGSHLRLFNYPESSYSRQLQDRSRYGIRTPFLSNSFAAYRRSALDRIGGFKERLIFGEDFCAGAALLLAGYTIAYAADAMVYHSHDYSPLMEFRRYFDIGVLHKKEAWIVKEFGRAEGEGMRYLKSGISYLKKTGKAFRIPEFLLRIGLKFVGHSLGRNYEKIPLSVIRRISMNSHWWDEKNAGEAGEDRGLL